MKQKEKTALRSQSVAELKKRRSETEQKLAAFRLSRYTKQSKNVRESKQLRQQIAILSTVIAEKEQTHE